MLIPPLNADVVLPPPRPMIDTFPPLELTSELASAMTTPSFVLPDDAPPVPCTVRGPEDPPIIFPDWTYTPYCAPKLSVPPLPRTVTVPVPVERIVPPATD